MASAPGEQRTDQRVINAFLGMALSALAVFGIVYNLLAAWLVTQSGRVARATRAAPHVPQGVTILKPLHGAEPALASNLASFLQQDHAGPVQIIFGVRDANDAALEVARAVVAAHPNVDCAIIVDDRQHGANNKLSNLINMAVHIRQPLVVIADSDVDAPPDTLTHIARQLADPGVGIVSLLHVGRDDVGGWSVQAAMDISYRFMPSVILGSRLGLAHPVLGPIMALRRETLDAIGGFARFCDVLADDYELGRAVRERGLRVRVADHYVTHGCSETSFSALIKHELRWTRTILAIDPAGFTGSLITHAVPNALLAVMMTQAAPVQLVLLVAALIARAGVKAAIDRASESRSGPIFLLPLRDILSYAVFIITFFVQRVEWRGAHFAVNADGTITPKRPK